MGEDGTATEIKSISGKLSEREVEQLGDYLKMARGGAEVGQMGRRIKKIRYTFTRTEGLKANMERVEELLGDDKIAEFFSCEVFLADGTRVPINDLTDLNAIKAAL